jgi:hypothetical protein
MKHLNHTIDFAEVQNFVEEFRIEYPHLYPLVTLDEVANWLEQLHIKQYDKNPDKKLVLKFRMGLFADWLLANELTEVQL